jgi:hypothetical protein
MKNLGNIDELLTALDPSTENQREQLADHEDIIWQAIGASIDSGNQKPRRPSAMTTGLLSFTSAPRRLALVAAAFALVVGVGVVVGTSAVTPVVPAGAAAFSLLSDTGPTIAPFVAAIGSPQGLSQMTCPSSHVCYLQSTVTTKDSTSNALIPRDLTYRSTDGGATWDPISLPAGTTIDTPFTCPTATSCMVGVRSGGNAFSGDGYVHGAVQSMLFTSDGGVTWTSRQVPMPPITGNNASLDTSLTTVQGTLYGLQCFNASSCIGFGTVPSDQAEQPTNETPAIGILRTVVVRTTDAGATWATTVLPWSTTPTGGAGWSNEQQTSFSCADTTNCVGLATVLGQPSSVGIQSASLLALRSSDGGATWTSHWVASFEGGQASLTCADASHCYAAVIAGAFGAATSDPGVLATSDGGATWAQENVFPSGQSAGAGLTSIACSSGATCWASGYELSATNSNLTTGAIYVTHDGGTTWVPAVLPAGVGIVTQVSCSESKSCIAIAQPPTASGSTAPVGAIPSQILTNGLVAG